MKRLLALVLLAVLATAACDNTDSDADTEAGDGDEKVTLRLVSHDSFAASEDVLEAFEKASGIKVEVVESGDAGAALNQAILTKDDPIGDVFFGVDNTFLTRALDEDIFIPYESPRLDAVDARYVLDDKHRVTPIDRGDVCINYDKEYFTGASQATTAPSKLEDLTAAPLKGKLVVENPATSSPGLAFLLASVAHFGEDGWKDFWRDLRANDVRVASGWEEAYNQAFSGGAGQGDRPLVVSYASSPAAEVVFADPQPTVAPTGVMTATCFEQIEFAGILRGTEHEAEARELVDFLLSKEFQEDMPLNMFVFPVVDDAELPDAFTKHAATVDEPLQLPHEDIGESRDALIKEWTSIVLG